MKFQQEPERIFALDSAGNLIAEVTFPISRGVAAINHTFVDPSLRGQGIANQLLCAVAEHLRARGLKANPTCSYADQWFSRHPEQADLLCANS